MTVAQQIRYRRRRRNPWPMRMLFVGVSALLAIAWAKPFVLSVKNHCPTCGRAATDLQMGVQNVCSKDGTEWTVDWFWNKPR